MPKREQPEPATYVFCERVTAGPTSPMHIRRITATGLHTSGGADTPALCGAEVAWDLYEIRLSELPIMLDHQHDTFRICASCATAAGNEPSQE